MPFQFLRVIGLLLFFRFFAPFLKMPAVTLGAAFSENKKMSIFFKMEFLHLAFEPLSQMQTVESGTKDNLLLIGIWGNGNEGGMQR